ncbi:MAG: transporter [Flavobacteriales bacterium]|nr:transporter [Flavobacteriales bacterium]
MIRSLLSGALALATLPSLGCDVCGMFMSLQPHDRTSTIGLSWRMRYREGTYTSTGFALAKHGGADHATVDTRYREIYQVADLRADLWFGQRWAVLGSLPLVNNYQSVDGLTTADMYGVGDALVIGRYLLAGTHCGPEEQRARHRLMLGAGLKLPTGASDRTFNGGPVGPDLQPGTGTVDVLGSLEYLYRKGAWGAGLNAIGRFNGVHQGYRFGHGLNLTGEAFRLFEAQAIRFMPSAGGYLELASLDAMNGAPVEGTGGPTLFTHLASRVWWRSWSLGLTWQHAMVDKQGSMMVPNRERVIIGISYNI